MYPRIGGIENLDGLGLYYPVLVLATVIATVVPLWLLAREGVPVRRLAIYVACLAVGGFLGAKLYSIVFQGGFRGLDVEVAGGWRYPGSLLGILIAGFAFRCFLPKGFSAARYFDAWAPGFSFGIGIGRIGCLLWGCCHGAVSSWPWALTYPRGSIAWFQHFDRGEIAVGAASSLLVHPLPLYLFSMEFALGFFLLWFRGRKAYDGQVLLAFLLLHGTFKYLLEYFRDPVHWMHQTVLPIAMVAGLVLLVVWARRGTASRLPAMSSART